MDKNHRQYLREVPEKFAFIQIERDEVGRVLNVSEGGLSFSSFGPVPANGPVYFWFSFDLRNRIEAMGELAWTDLSGKVGGLRFTQLSERGRKQIREWLSQFPSREVSRGGPRPRVVQEVEVAKLPQGKPDRVASFVAKARSRSPVLSLNTGNYEEPPVPVPALGEIKSTELVPLQRHRSAKKKQLILGVLLGALITAGVTVAAVKYTGYRHRAQDPAPVRAQSAPLKSDSQALPPAPKPASAPSPAFGDVFNPGKENRGTLPKSTPSKQVAAFYARAQSQTQALESKAPNQSSRMPGQLQVSGTPSSSKKQMTPAQSQTQTLEPKASNQSARMPSQLQVSGTASPSKKQMTRAQLWAAVQAGNSNAAVTLAELYIKGEGVGQNCQQARILLLVASEKSNPAAIKRLQELDKDKETCP
jgi:hypothetical protein